MFNLDQVAAAVQRNCHISDARFAGNDTVCVFLMKMREFYRWEQRLPVGNALPKHEVGEWLVAREKLWDEVGENDFDPLPLAGGGIDPFDSATANRELVPRGLLYSGGYGRHRKPHFFLADLLHTEARAGFTIYIAGREYARDLDAPPAMLQGREIFIRRESLRRYLWERIEEWAWNRRNRAMGRALDAYGFDIDGDRETALDRILENEMQSALLHELGEGLAGELLGETWPRMIADLPRSRVEIMARAVRDIVADLLTTLPTLIDTGNRPALHFYFALFTGMRRQLFPALHHAYEEWAESGTLRALSAEVARGRDVWLATARALLDLHQRDPAGSADAIETLLQPGCALE